MGKKIYLIIIVLMTFVTINAQLKVSSTGNVGIQTGTDTILSALSIGTSGGTNCKFSLLCNSMGLDITRTGTSALSWTYGALVSSDVTPLYSIGIRGQSYSSSLLNYGRAWGVFGLAGNSSNGYNYGVMGVQYGTGNGAGIVGTTGGNANVYVPGIYAGYFVGDVKVTGVVTATNITSSDRRLKDNIVEISKGRDALNGILSLNPVEYNYKQRYIKAPGDTSKVGKPYYDKSSQIFKKKQFGLIAQEVQTIYPELVYTDPEGYLAINYTGLIPLLIQSIKELNAEVELLKANSGSSSKVISGSSSTGVALAASLSQNIPNPFNVSTKINFYLPKTVVTANLYIYDMNGTQLKDYSISERGNGNVVIQGSEFNAGMYLYSLIADGKVVDTKRMILTK